MLSLRNGLNCAKFFVKSVSSNFLMLPPSDRNIQVVSQSQSQGQKLLPEEKSVRPSM